MSEYEEGFRAGYEAGLATARRDIGSDMGSLNPATSFSGRKPKKRTRKASKYNLTYAKVYKILKKKHPRTSFAALAKKAHKETKRRMKQ